MFGDYFILVFLACIGAFQIVAVPAGLKGIWFFNRPSLQYVFGVLVILGAFGWFFSSENRNFQHRVEGSQQLGLFLLAVVLSWIATLVLSSIIEANSQGENPPKEGKQGDIGIEALRTRTFFQALVAGSKEERNVSE